MIVKRPSLPITTLLISGRQAITLPVLLLLLELVADAASHRHYREGDTVQLHFPPERIWLIQDES